MEQDAPQENVQEENGPQTTPVTPVGGENKKTKSKGVLITIVIVILLGVTVAGAFVFKRKNSVPEPSPTPELTGTITVATPSPAVEDTIDKDTVAISVLNGTGIAGEATFLQNRLRNLDYTNIEVGNASSQGKETTTASFAKNLPQTIVDEITNELEKVYKDVSTKSSSSLDDNEVQIITGLKKGQTFPSPTPTAVATPSPSPSASPSPSPSATPAGN